MIPAAATLAELAENHDVFFIDQFGVLHDGVAPYPGAVEALSRLKRMGRTVVLLSNSGKRAALNEKRVLDLGFERGSWDRFVSSGEIAWSMMAGGALLPAHGARVFMIARDGDRSAIDGLDCETTDDAGGADLVLIAASEGDTVDLEGYRAMLAPAAERKTPCLCTNPDRVMLTPDGPRFGAGRIGEVYEALGGAVTWIGKPYGQIYAAALEAVGNPDGTRVVCVGDSIEHDIAGAENAGLHCALVRSGILADTSEADLPTLYAEAGATPDFILDAFCWR